MAAVDTAPDVVRIRNSGHLLDADRHRGQRGPAKLVPDGVRRSVNGHTTTSRMRSQGFLTITGNPKGTPRPMTEFVAESADNPSSPAQSSPSYSP